MQVQFDCLLSTTILPLRTMLPVDTSAFASSMRIRYRRSFFLPDIQECSVEEYVNALSHRDNQHQQYMEWVSNDIRRMYFDIELKKSAYQHLEMPFEEMRQNTLTECLAILRSLLLCEPVTIACASKEVDSVVEGIISFHITYAYTCHRNDNKILATKANELVAEQPFLKLCKKLPFDTTIYKSVQGWRSIGMTKPHTNRPFKLLLGVFADSLLQNHYGTQPYELPAEHVICTTTTNVPMVYQSTGNNFMDFFNAALDRSELQALWRTKSCNATEMLQVLQTLIFESQKRDGVLNDSDVEVTNAQVLFKKFFLIGNASLSTPCGSYDMEVQMVTYMRQRGKLIIGFAQKIMGWVRNANDVVYKALVAKKKKSSTPIAQTVSINFAFDFDALDFSSVVANTDPIDGLSDGRAITRVHYILIGLFCVEQLWPLLKHFFGGKNNIARLVSVFYSMDAEDFWIFTNIITLGEQLKELQTTPPIAPYECDGNFIPLLIKTVQRFKFLEIDEQDVYAFIKATPPVANDYSIYQSFEASLKTYLYSFYHTYKCVTVKKTIAALEMMDEVRSMSYVRILDKQSPWQRIQFIIENDSRWTYEVPYYYLLEKEGIIQAWQQEEDRVTIQLQICRYCSTLFAADIAWHMLTNVSSDKAAADAVYSMYPFFINTPAGFMMFDMHTGIWTMDELCWSRLIHKYSVLLWAKKKDSWLRYGEDIAALNKVTTSLKSVIPATFVPFMDMKSSSLRKLLYNNGIYDGIKQQFIPAECVDGIYYFDNTTIMFFGKIDDDYLPYQSKYDADLLDMRDALFYQIHGEEIGNYQIEKLACALLGEPFKGFFVNIGDPNSGKSTLKAMIESAFGSYVGTGTMDQLAMIPNDSRDTGIANSILYHNWYKRLLLFSEKAGQRKLDTEKIKQYASGQKDKAVTRIQHKPDIVVDIHFVMSFYVNSDIEVDKPQDAGYIDRYNAFYSNKAFVPAEQLSDPTCQLIARPEVCEWQHSKYRRQLFNLIFIQAYEEMKRRGQALPMPKGTNMVSKNTTQAPSVNMELMEQVLSQFIVDGQSTSTVAFSDIDKAINGEGKRFIIRFQHIIKTLSISVPVVESKKVYDSESRKYITKWIGIRARSAVEADGAHAVLKNFDEWKFLMKHFNGVIPKDAYAKLYLLSQYKTHKEHFEERNGKPYEMPDTMAVALNIASAIQTNVVEFDKETLQTFSVFVESGVQNLKAELAQSIGLKRKHD